MGRVAVVGSLNMDLAVRVPRWPGPGETVLGLGLHMSPGGKGLNQAAAARRAGAEVLLVGRVGADPFGDALRAALEQEGIDGRYVRTDRGRGTGVAIIALDPSGQNQIVAVPQANGAVQPGDVDAAAADLVAADVLLLQGEVPLPASLRAAELAAAAGRPIVFNPAPVPPPGPELDRLLALASLVLPNEAELAGLTGNGGEAAVRALRRRTGGPVLVTLGAEGAALLEDPHGPLHRLPAHRVEVVDTVGAGDACAGALAAALAEGRPLRAAAAWGMAAGALACTRPGALPAMPRREDIGRLLAGSG